MAILPLDSGRYGMPEMRTVFLEETRLQRMLDVEAALAWAQGQVGDIPREDAVVIIEKASLKYVSLTRVNEIESRIKHQTMAMVEALTEACGRSGAYVHLGVTSSDVLDTATALQLKEAVEIIEKRLKDLGRTLKVLAQKHMKTLMVGRTHGQHALPTTLGFKFANWLSEVIRHLTRLEECYGRVIVGKLSGAVGTQAGLGHHALKIQKLAMEKLGLRRAEISTQIISRDRYAELICILANISSSLDSFATEIRELQRPEIGELAESFDEAKQVGSSTMPQKRNPILCERISGLARILRGLTVPALENVVTWHERDLTQSSSERFIFPEACILVDYMISLMDRILKGLVVDEERMRRNLDLSQGRLLSEAVMMQLVKNGMRRRDAYHLMRQLTLQSEKNGGPLKDILLEDAKIRRFLSETELSNALNPEKYLGSALKQIEDVLKHSTF